MTTTASTPQTAPPAAPNTAGGATPLPVRTPGNLRHYAHELGGKIDETYRFIEAGKGYFDVSDTGVDLGFYLSGFISPANAERIVHCWNQHDALVEALRSSLELASIIDNQGRIAAARHKGFFGILIDKDDDAQTFQKLDVRRDEITNAIKALLATEPK